MWCIHFHQMDTCRWIGDSHVTAGYHLIKTLFLIYAVGSGGKTIFRIGILYGIRLST